MASNRNDGYRTYDIEVMDVLDCVSPNTERLYRKLFQRVNLTRGDMKAWPSWKRMQEDTGFSKATLSKSIQELEHFCLISVNRPSKTDAQQKHAYNEYFLTLPNELPTGSVLNGLVSQWNQLLAEMSAKEKARKEKKLVSQTDQATLTDRLELVSQTETNQDEENYDEKNKDEAQLFEKNEPEDSPIPVQEVIFSETERSSTPQDQAIPVKNLFGADLEKTGAPCIYDDFPKWKEIEPIYNGTRGTEDERLMAVVANWRDADVERLKTVIWMGTHDILSEKD